MDEFKRIKELKGKYEINIIWEKANAIRTYLQNNDKEKLEDLLEYDMIWNRAPYKMMGAPKYTQDLLLLMLFGWHH